MDTRLHDLLIWTRNYLQLRGVANMHVEALSVILERRFKVLTKQERDNLLSLLQQKLLVNFILNDNDEEVIRNMDRAVMLSMVVVIRNMLDEEKKTSQTVITAIQNTLNNVPPKKMKLTPDLILQKIKLVEIATKMDLAEDDWLTKGMV